jgi:tyrosyl-tRNA synthetase
MKILLVNLIFKRKLLHSKCQARRFIGSAAVKINGNTITDIGHEVDLYKSISLQIGKNYHEIIPAEGDL